MIGLLIVIGIWMLIFAVWHQAVFALVIFVIALPIQYWRQKRTGTMP